MCNARTRECARKCGNNKKNEHANPFVELPAQPEKASSLASLSGASRRRIETCEPGQTRQALFIFFPRPSKRVRASISSHQNCETTTKNYLARRPEMQNKQEQPLPHSPTSSNVTPLEIKTHQVWDSTSCRCASRPSEMAVAWRRERAPR